MTRSPALSNPTFCCEHGDGWMMGTHRSRLCRFSDRITLGGAIGLDELRTAAEKDHRVVIDLRTGTDLAAGGLDPMEEQRQATALGLAYHRVPISGQARDDGSISTVRDLVRRAGGRVLLHCTNGARAAALALIHLGCDEGASLGECYGRLKHLELPSARSVALVPLWIGYILDHAARDDGGPG